jgi:hypothetical protein
MIGNKTFTTLTLAAAFGILGVASAVASESGNRGARGGYVLPGSLDGVNPAYHPEIFGNPAAASAYGFVQSPNGAWHVQPNWHRDRR